MDEADSAADAGVGAQALLGLAAGKNVRLPSLAVLSETSSRHVQPETEAPNVAPLQLPAVSTCQSLLYAQHSSVSSQPPQLQTHTQPQQQPQSEVHSREQIQRNETKIPAISQPSVSETTTEGGINGATPDVPTSATPDISVAQGQGSIPHLASISEWAPPRAHAQLPAVGAFPTINRRQLPSPPPAESSMSLSSSQLQGEVTHPGHWANAPLHALPPQTPGLPSHYQGTPTLQHEWSSPVSLVYPYAASPASSIQTQVPTYYYPPTNSPHYLQPSAQLPQLQPQHGSLPIGRYSIAAHTTEQGSVLRPPLPSPIDHRPMADPLGAQGAMPQPPSHHARLPPLANEDRKEAAPMSRTTFSPSAGVSALLCASRMDSSPEPLAHQTTVKSSPGRVSGTPRKSVFVGSDSGRGLVDLMNPTDTMTCTDQPENAVAEPVGTGKRTTPTCPSDSTRDRTNYDEGGRHPQSPCEVESGNDALTDPRKVDVTQMGSNASLSGFQRTGGGVEGGSGNAVSDMQQTARTSVKRAHELLGDVGRSSAKPEATVKDEARNVAEHVDNATEKQTMSATTDAQSEQAKQSPKFVKRKSEGNTADQAIKTQRSQSDGISDPPASTDGAESEKSGDSEVTRCPCGSTADSGTMIACDQCNTWQHRICMGFRRKSDVPNLYYCNVCRPEEMRPNCVAHPKYKERQMARERENKEKGKDFESMLVAVKPLELRKQFALDIRAKRGGSRPFVSEEVFHRYAHLYRTQFSKDRQSVIEGLVVLTDLSRTDVSDRLELAIRRNRESSVGSADGLDTTSAEGAEQRRTPQGTAITAQSMPSQETNGSHAHSRNAAQKRSRPHSLGIDTSLDAGELTRVGMLSASQSLDKDAMALDVGNGRSLSREERKMQQVMNLFARLEERERDRKKQRVEANGSPRVASLPSPKPNGVAPTTRVVSSPKSPSRVVKQSESPDQPRGRTSVSPSSDRPKHISGAASPKSEIPVPTAASSANGKRERQRGDRKENRRREARSLSASAGSAASRRNGIMARRKEGELVSSALQPERGTKADSVGSRKDLDRSSHVRGTVPGPSVLGSALVPSTRRSALDRDMEQKEANEILLRKSQCGRRSNKKAWLLHGEASSNSATVYCIAKRPPRYPLRKRVLRDSVLMQIGEDPISVAGDASNSAVIRSSDERECQQSPGQVPKSPVGTPKKGQLLSVSMVVVSEREQLPDGGEQLERPRLVEPVMNASGEAAPPSNGMGGRKERIDFCLKKRIYMLNPKRRSRVTDGKTSTGDSENSNATPSVAPGEGAQRTPASRPLALRSAPISSSPEPSSPGSHNSRSPIGSEREQPPMNDQGDAHIQTEPPVALKKRILKCSNTDGRVSPSRLDAEKVAPEQDGEQRLVDGDAQRAESTNLTKVEALRRSGPLRGERELLQPSQKEHPTRTLTACEQQSASGSRSEHISQAPAIRSSGVTWDPQLRSDSDAPEKKSPQADEKTPKQSAGVKSHSGELPLALPASEEGTASNVLQQRLQVFLNRSTTTKEAASTNTALGAPAHYGSFAAPDGSPSANGKRHMSKYSEGGGVGGQWRSTVKGVTAKRIHGPSGLGAASPSGSFHVSKLGFDRGAARGGGKLSMSGGKMGYSGSDDKGFATPWRNYRQQNGWSGSGGGNKHSAYSTLPSSAPDRGGGRRRPYG